MLAVFLSGVWRAVLAGLLAGAVVTAAGIFLTMPLIAIGEQLEGNLTNAPNLLAPLRFSGTIIANLTTAIALSLWLFAILYMFNLRINKKNAFAWVMCFWLAVFFIPAAAMPPTLPGMAAHGDLPLRQTLWVGLVLLSTMGLLLHTAFFINLMARNLRLILSVILLTVPSLVAMVLLPTHLDPLPGAAPTAAAALFVMRSLLSGLLLSATIVMFFATAAKK